MRSIPLLACVLLLGLAPAAVRAQPAGGHVTENLPEFQAADTAAPAVTEQNLLASERFWPYQAALVRPLGAPGRVDPLPVGLLGVLIRIEPVGQARLDFGRDGLFEVPVGATDVVERANRVRRGELAKMAPNFVLALGPRLVDAGAEQLRAFPLREAAGYPLFLAVFADPDADGFDALAAGLAPLRGRDGLLTILLPQGERPDAAVRERLRAAAWPVPFVYDHLAEPYTRTLLPEGIAPPAVQLQTPEGRVLFQQPWGPEVVSPLVAAVEAARESAAGDRTSEPEAELRRRSRPASGP